MGVHDNLIGLYEGRPVNGASGSFYFPSSRSGNTAVPRTLWLTVAEVKKQGEKPSPTTIGRCKYEEDRKISRASGGRTIRRGTPPVGVGAASARTSAGTAVVLNPASRERARPS